MNSAIPEQSQGAQSNTEASAACRSVEEAAAFYRTARGRLLSINDWKKVAGGPSAEFVLTDGEGRAVSRDPQINDHFRIDIPGPGPVNGDGYDWVKVEEVSEQRNDEKESILIRVRPATSPLNKEKGVAHFFTEEATSCFVISRTGKIVTASVFGRNEKPNTAVEKTIDKARNTAVASGAVTAFSKLQWKSLVEGLVKVDG